MVDVLCAISEGLRDEFLGSAPRGRWAMISEYRDGYKLAVWYHSWLVEVFLRPSHILVEQSRRNGKGRIYQITEYEYERPGSVERILDDMSIGTRPNPRRYSQLLKHFDGTRVQLNP